MNTLKFHVFPLFKVGGQPDKQACDVLISVTATNHCNVLGFMESSDGATLHARPVRQWLPSRQNLTRVAHNRSADQTHK